MNLDQITREILHFEDLSTEHAECAVKFRAEIGRRLIAAKAILPHGRFMPWVKQSFHWDHSHVNRHMQLARNWERVQNLPPDASLRMCIEAIANRARVAATRPEHARMTIPLDSGGEAVIELRTGDLAAFCETLQARGVSFRLFGAVKAA